MRRYLAAVAFAGALSLFTPAAQGSTTYTSAVGGSGALNIPDAVGAVPGSLSCVIPIFDPGSIGAGNQVTLSLLGLQHEAAADLDVTITHYADLAQTIILGGPQFAFSRIGKASNDPNDFGYLPQFGDPAGTADNYSFNSGFLGDIWTTAFPLGSSEFIPGQAQFAGLYWTTDPFSGAPNAFSSSFGGQAVAGYWRLDITDNAEGPTVGSFGSLLQFQLTFEDVTTATVPEPSYSAALVLLFTVGAIARRRRQG